MAKTMVRYNEHFNARTRRESMFANAALVVGGGLSLFFTKQRPHNLACGALSYMAAKQALQYVDVEPSEQDRLPLTTKEYDWLQR